MTASIFFMMRTFSQVYNIHREYYRLRYFCTKFALFFEYLYGFSDFHRINAIDPKGHQ